MRTQVFKFLCVLMFLVLGACSSTDTTTDNAISDADVAADFGGDESDDFSDDFGEEFGDEEEAFADSGSSDQVADQSIDQTTDEFSDFDDFEEPLDEDFGNEDLAAEDSVVETPVEDSTPVAVNEEQPLPEDDLSDFSVVDESGTPVTVQAIDFVANQNGGTLKVKTSDVASYQGRFNSETNQYILEIDNATLPSSLKRPYIMKDFQTAFGTVNSYQNSGGSTARIVVQMKNASEPIVQQEGDVILLVASGEVKEVAVEEPKKEEDWKNSYNVTEAEKQERILGARTLEEFLSGNTQFFGRPISIQVDNADVRDVINFIADESGVNLVLSEDVTGNISLKLRQIPWDQALVIIMRSKGLGYVRQGNVLRITELEKLQAETKAAQEIVDAQNKLTPLKVKVIPVSYATVADLEKQVEPFLTPERGKVVSDSRTSSLIITDTPDVLGRVERLVQELDIPPAQVMIEGKIVEASESFSKTVGVNWGFSGTATTLASSGGADGNPVELTPSFESSTFTESLAGNFNLNIGTLDVIGSLDAQLGLAQTDSLVKIVSSPRIVTMNREQATISQESEVLTSRSVDNGVNVTTSVERTPVELVMEVTPQITAEGSVILDVNVQRQFAGELQADVSSRPVNTREAKTKILVPNGQTAVIGGIYQSDETSTESGLPGLKNIPVVGWLFKQKKESFEKNELLIFLTPRILNAKDQSVTRQ